jgi:hypothetical protein
MLLVKRFLHLTSPLMQGADVKVAQLRLHGDSDAKFGNFHPGGADGEYGERSAAATRRGKHWLGYADKSINGVYGPRFDEYLTGRRALTPAMKLRRRRRLKRAADKPLRLKVYEKAFSQIGIKESPAGSNRVKYSTWYGMIGAWCAMFCSWCSDQAGGKFHYAYCPYVVRDAKAGINAMRVVPWADVRRGDFPLYDWDRDGVADHIGVFESWIQPGASFTAIEGNTAVGNDSNGGAVMRRTRYRPDVICFVRVEK